MNPDKRKQRFSLYVSWTTLGTWKAINWEEILTLSFWSDDYIWGHQLLPRIWLRRVYMFWRGSHGGERGLRERRGVPTPGALAPCYITHSCLLGMTPLQTSLSAFWFLLPFHWPHRPLSLPRSFTVPISVIVQGTTGELGTFSKSQRYKAVLFVSYCFKILEKLLFIFKSISLSLWYILAPRRLVSSWVMPLW